jgi:ABC-2 type transport system permease protein
VFSIFKGAQIELWRSKIGLFFILLFPSLLVFILGTMLANLDNPDWTIEPFELAYVIDSDDPATVQAAEAVIVQFEDVEQVSFVEGASLVAVERQLQEGELGAAVVFTEPFGIEIHEGADATQNRAVRSIFDGVAHLYGTVGVAMSEASGGFDPNVIANLATGQPRIEEKTYGVSRTMIDYYAITMIVMIFLMGNAISSASSFYNQRKDGTLRRILASPQSRVSVYLQMVLQSVPQNLVQVLAAMFISVTFFGARYAATWQLNVLLFAMLFVVGLAVSSLFLLLGIFIRVNPMLVLMPLTWVLLFVSGSFSKEIFIPGVTTVSPPWLVQTAAFDLTLFGNVGPSVVVSLVSLALIAASTLAGCLLINRKELVI